MYSRLRLSEKHWFFRALKFAMNCRTSAPLMASSPWTMALRYVATTDTRYGGCPEYILEIRDTKALQVVVAGEKPG